MQLGRRSYSTALAAVVAPKKQTPVVPCQTLLNCTYVEGWKRQNDLLQHQLAAKRTRSDDDSNTVYDTVLCLHHSHPVYTLGRGAQTEHLTFLKQQPPQHSPMNDETTTTATTQTMLQRLNGRGPGSARLDASCCIDTIVPVLLPNDSQPPIPIYRVERGGQVTYHGPGQLVVYPVLNLERYQKDLHWFVQDILEQCIIDALAEFGIDDAVRHADHTGVWVGPPDDPKKIAAIGIACSRWITTHGLALNVCPNLNHFDTNTILPCGIPDMGVTCMETILGKDHTPSLAQVQDVLLRHLGRLLHVEIVPEGQ